MERTPRTLTVKPESDLALLIKRANSRGESMVVDTGDEVYRLDVRRATPADLGGIGAVSDDPVVAIRKRLAAELAGSLAGVDIPGWESPDAAAQWVRESRRADMFPLDQHKQG